ncbi:MAG: nickel pincer cofactor biosynthesis protein LarB [Anaerolineae bacterium]
MSNASQNSRAIQHLNRIEAALPDLERHDRIVVPEVILAENKTADRALDIADAFLKRTGRAILSRVDDHLHDKLADRYRERLEWHPASRMAIVRDSGHKAPPQTGGRVGVITAGTSDQPVAEEATLVLREMGCSVITAYDVGVAGLHRLFEPLRHLLGNAQVDVIIVAAGMDGALPSVVSGLVDVPVIGLPTSVGYGLGGQGEAAILTMLQSCSPGLSVVNIDNGVGAAAVAGLIAVRCARARNASAKGEPAP